MNAALEAYERGDFFEAHELLEPAWMGTADLAERALYQGLIKLAAGYVHWVRGNPTGMRQNLEGARRYLEEARGSEAARSAGVDVGGTVAAIDLRLEILRAMPPSSPRAPGTPRFLPHDPVRDVPDAPRLR